MTTKTKLLFVVAVACSIRLGAPAAAASGLVPPFCDDVCSSSACTDQCYVDQMAFDNGNPITCLAWGDYDTGQACCGDGACDTAGGEEMCNCSQDCGSCPQTFPECNPISQTGCASGQVCNNLGYCKDVPECHDGNCDNGTKPTPPACFDNRCSSKNDCCQGNICTGYWYVQEWDVTFLGWCTPVTSNTSQNTRR